jgi:hypothetical protein
MDIPLSRLSFLMKAQSLFKFLLAQNCGNLKQKKNPLSRMKSPAI